MQRRRLLAACAAVCVTPACGPLRAETGFDVQSWPANQAAPLQLSGQEPGRNWVLADMRGRAVLINFWASWCEPCRQEMPSLQRLAASRAQELIVLTVNFKDAPRSAEQFMAQTDLQLPVVSDRDGALARQWGVRVFPSTVLIDSEGVVLSTVRGAIDWMGPAAQQIIQPLLKRAPAGAAPRLAP
jgi:thiol-disulfide isomerase/thioredoxin